MMGESLEGFNFSDNVERNGLPNGAIHAAYVRFPTNFSNCLNGTTWELNIRSIRVIYFLCFGTDNLQLLQIESYMKPRISITRAGGRHFFLFIFVPVQLPTAKSSSNIKSALRLSTKIPFLLLFGPPKKSSTYASNTTGIPHFFWKWTLKAFFYAVV